MKGCNGSEGIGFDNGVCLGAGWVYEDLLGVGWRDMSCIDGMASLYETMKLTVRLLC